VKAVFEGRSRELKTAGNGAVKKKTLKKRPVRKHGKVRLTGEKQQPPGGVKKKK